jgi:hypothetical protein
MTSHKHTTHWDSELARSLEKVAREKGLIKLDPLKKEASLQKSNIDLLPSSDLMENILKLCQGLRSEGFSKEAIEVETNYLQYKKAQTLYQAHLETGEDLIHSAHPKGSHHLEGVDSDEATVEDILDKHLKIMEVMNKKPTGKLSSAHSILQAVKVVLGSNEISNILLQAKNKIERAMTISENELTIKDIPLYRKTFNDMFSEEPTIDNLNFLTQLLNKLQNRLKPDFMGGISEDTWSVASQLINSARDDITKAKEKRKDIRNQDGKDAVMSPSTNTTGALATLLTQIASLKSRVKGFTALLSNQPKAMQFVHREIASLDQMIANFKNIAPEQVEHFLPKLQAAIDKETNDINTFEKAWIE